MTKAFLLLSMHVINAFNSIHKTFLKHAYIDAHTVSSKMIGHHCLFIAQELQDKTPN